MIKIKTILKESTVHKGGIGLFACEHVRKGEIVIVPSTPGLDIELEKETFGKLTKEESEFILHYGFVNKFNGKFHLNFDNVRFINHSKDGNLSLDKKTQSLSAVKDIEPGEELTEDYLEFEKNEDFLNRNVTTR